MQQKTEITKSPHDMTIQELQEEIGKLQSIVHFKVCGDPTKGISQDMTAISIAQCNWHGPAIWEHN